MALEREGTGVRRGRGAMALGCEGTGVRRGCAAKGAGCDGAGRCRMVRDGTGRHNRAQAGATGRRRGSRRLANPVKLGAPPALCGRVEQICTEAARAAAQRRRRELLKGRRSPTP